MSKGDRTQIDTFLSFGIVFFIFFFDRMTKSFFSNLLSVGESIPVVKNVLHFSLVHNTGIAFGFFKDQGAVFIIIPIIAIILLFFNIYYYKQNDEALSRSYIVSFSLILGGAIGNLVDRVLFGHVIDFIDFRVFPVFNVADSAITIGASVIAFKCFQLSSK